MTHDGIGPLIVDIAEAALRAFGGDMNRRMARRLLQGWKFTPDLTPREREAVLGRFPDDPPVPGDPPAADPQHGSSGPGGPVFPGSRTGRSPS